MGVTALRRWQQARDPRVTILTYHGISARNFERHLQWLTAHYHIVSLAEAVQWVGGNDRYESRRVVLTFDDGYKSFITIFGHCCASTAHRQRCLP